MKSNSTIMKTIQPLLFLFFLYLAPDQTFAQPGDDDKIHHSRYFHQRQDSVLKNPDNVMYKWMRLDLLFNPYFRLQTKPTKSLSDYLRHSDQYHLYVEDSITEWSRPHYMSSDLIVTKTYNPARELGDFLLGNQDKLIEELSKLIDTDAKFIDEYSRSVDKPFFLYKRGQFQYLSGNPEKGLKDFISALDYSPTVDLKKRIYTSIAAYYYNNEQLELKENYRLALQYIRLTEPVIEDSSYSKGEEPMQYLYEKEKLDVMRKYGDSTEYVNYLQNRVISYLNHYYSLMETMKPEDHYYYKCDDAFERSRKYELMIYNYLIELNPSTGAEEFKKHKKLIIEKI